MPVDDWLVQLDNLAARSAGFFLRKPIVLDLSSLDIGQDELRDLVAKLATRKVRIMGIEGAKASLLAPDLPPALTDGKGTSDVEITAVEESSAPAAANPAPTVSAPSRSSSSLIVSQPVRSGQSLHHAEGDVTIVGSVASGSEVVAGGSIHVYGALRGRAMAGTMGNSTARIFCRKLEAELIAIDGFYLTAEDLEPSLRGKAVQIWLEGETIKVAAVI
ncbi:septum site-determining protein MinC [Pararhizobium capsulatum DSM 1112]|uniref:Probable septum site-determining protein MinC n=2 Tax=Pararhizobium capsulatum TaxID=34014 RepID=A0ABU0BXJ4_9HYPH|nr:septum site-determining protein MinC [Pararhizobium capsulatum DSM 1112]